MRQFFKYVFATVIGLFVFCIVALLGFILILSAALSGREAVIAENSVLKLNLDQQIIEREKDDLFAYLTSPFGQDEAGTNGLLQLTQAIKKAKEDDRIRGILLEVYNPQAGIATLEELRNSLEDFKSSGKFIVAYGENYTEGSYYLASVADKIYLPPSGMLEFNGLDYEMLFIKGTLEKLGLQPEIFKVGSFKSAVEPLTNTEMSEANRLQVQTFLNNIYSHFLEGISTSRNIPVEQLAKISDSMLVRSAEDALNFKLVTDLGYYSEVLDYLKKEKLALAENEKIKFVRYTDLNDKAINEESMVSGKSKIVVIYGTGSIEDGKSDQNSIGSYTFSEEIRKARLDEDVKAIVLRINSPGGSALASDVIWKEVELTKKVKPVVASMSDMAASGGYYIAMACDTIIAHPTTITGSIGVFGVLMNGKEFLEDKLGVTADRVTTGKFSDIGSFTRPITEFEKQIIQKEVERIYDQFTLKAAQGRQISVETMRDELAEGRVWSGIEAKNNKLVDGFGNLDDAIAIAAEMANQKEYQVVYWPEQKTTFLTQLIRQMEEEESKAIKLNLGSLYPVYKTIQNADKLNGVQARIPYELIIR